MTIADSMAKNLRSHCKDYQSKEKKLCDPAFWPEDTKDDGASRDVTMQEHEAEPANSLNTKGSAPQFTILLRLMKTECYAADCQDFCKF